MYIISRLCCRVQRCCARSCLCLTIVAAFPLSVLPPRRRRSTTRRSPAGTSRRSRGALWASIRRRDRGALHLRDRAAALRRARRPAAAGRPLTCARGRADARTADRPTRRDVVPVPLTAGRLEPRDLPSRGRAATSWSRRFSPIAARRCCATASPALDDETLELPRRPSGAARRGCTSGRRRRSPRSAATCASATAASSRRAASATRRRCGKRSSREPVTRAGAIRPAAVRLNDGRAGVSLRHDRSARSRRARAFALGLWMPDAAARLERFKALVAAGVSALSRVAARDAAVLAAARRPGDAAAARRRSPPTARRCRRPTARLLDARLRRRRRARRCRRGQLRGVDDDPIDAAWLVERDRRGRHVRSAPIASISSRSASGCSARRDAARSRRRRRRASRRSAATGC